MSGTTISTISSLLRRSAVKVAASLDGLVRGKRRRRVRRQPIHLRSHHSVDNVAPPKRTLIWLVAAVLAAAAGVLGSIGDAGLRPVDGQLAHRRVPRSGAPHEARRARSQRACAARKPCRRRQLVPRRPPARFRHDEALPARRRSRPPPPRTPPAAGGGRGQPGAPAVDEAERLDGRGLRVGDRRRVARRFLRARQKSAGAGRRHGPSRTRPLRRATSSGSGAVPASSARVRRRCWRQGPEPGTGRSSSPRARTSGSRTSRSTEAARRQTRTAGSRSPSSTARATSGSSAFASPASAPTESTSGARTRASPFRTRRSRATGAARRASSPSARTGRATRA